MNPFLIIIGMHRSGTSFLTRSFNLRGVYLGKLESLLSHEWQGTPENLKGHWENLKLLELSEKTLSLNKGTWDNIPNEIVINDEIGKEIRKVVQELSSYPTLMTGFKDPRIVLCYESWKKFLPTKILAIGIFRHPSEVAESLKVRNGFSLEKSLKLWEIYNKKMLEILEKNNGFLLNFNWTKEKILQEIDLICDKLKLPKISLDDWYSNKLIHHNLENSDLPDNIIALYEKLNERAERNSSIEVTLNFSKEEYEKILEELLNQIKDQGDYFKKIYDELKLQEKSLAIEKNEQVKNLENAVKEKDEQVKN